MKIKIMFPNRDGRLEFSKNELEKLLEEAYNEGYKDGKNSNSYTVNKDYTYYPSVSYLSGVTYNTDGAYSTHAMDNSVTAVSGLALNADNTVSLGTVELKGKVE